MRRRECLINSNPQKYWSGKVSPSAEHPLIVLYVDEFRFFTRALSEKDILRNYNHPLSGAESDLAIYWPMD